MMFFAATGLAAPAAPDLPAPQLTEQWEPIPPVVTAPADGVPSDAIVLFDGNNLSAWEAASGGPMPWLLIDGAMVPQSKAGHIRTKQAFADLQLHLEFRTPAEVHGQGQDRGNSGVFFMGLYELQVLDSYHNPTYVNGQAGSIYKQHSPQVNASRPPGVWQSFDVIWIAPRFGPAGELRQPARMTVFHNGVLIHHDVVLRGPTAYRGTPGYAAHAPRLPLQLQEHRNTTAFRNIWVRELPDLDPAAAVPN